MIKPTLARKFDFKKGPCHSVIEKKFSRWREERTSMRTSSNLLFDSSKIKVSLYRNLSNSLDSLTSVKFKCENIQDLEIIERSIR